MSKPWLIHFPLGEELAEKSLGLIRVLTPARISVMFNDLIPVFECPS